MIKICLEMCNTEFHSVSLFTFEHKISPKYIKSQMIFRKIL